MLPGAVAWMYQRALRRVCRTPGHSQTLVLLDEEELATTYARIRKFDTMA